MASEASGTGVILLSYNRPTMLEMAWDSIRTRDSNVRVILVDDGSDAFNAYEWANEHGIATKIIGARRSIDHRMTQPVLGRLINGALYAAFVMGLARVAYLCDDDVFAPGWLDAVAVTLAHQDGPHACRGNWRAFDDPLNGSPLDPRTRGVKSHAANLDVRRMTTGNFAHRAECYAEGLRWSEKTVAVHDDTFLWNLIRLHPLNEIVDVKVLAGYRREHQWNAANFTVDQSYGIGAYEALSRETLE